MSQEVIENFLCESIEGFRSYKTLAERAIEQVSDEEFFRAIDAEANSLATICKHIGGNLRSRWTDFLTADGEKPDRNRDSEFVAEDETRENVMRIWTAVWQAVLTTIGDLQPADLLKIVTIRGEDYTVLKAVNRSLTHSASHVGQIVLLAKHFRAAKWGNLSVPRNESEEYNRAFGAENSVDK